MDERFIEWMDEYGSNIHHRPTIDLTSKVTVAPLRATAGLFRISLMNWMICMTGRCSWTTSHRFPIHRRPRRCIHGLELARS
jgi:hypothetical protein